MEFVLNLLELVVSPESLAAGDTKGMTVLHYVAYGGSLKTAKALVRKNPNLPQIVNIVGQLPLYCSIFNGSKEMVWYFTSITKVDLPASLLNILHSLIIPGYFDIALYFVRSYPESAICIDDFGNSLLLELTKEPSSFLSTSNLEIFERWIYKFVCVEIEDSPMHLVNMEDFHESPKGFPALVILLQPRSFVTQVLRWFKRLLWKAISQLGKQLFIIHQIYSIWENSVDFIWTLKSMSHQITQFQRERALWLV
ncbi:hypothetical protein ACOSQ3_020444 [Xanthoceras sorbifolium]